MVRRGFPVVFHANCHIIVSAFGFFPRPSGKPANRPAADLHAFCLMISWISRISTQRALDLYEELRVSFGERSHQQLSDNLEVRSWTTNGSSNSLSIRNRRRNGATKPSAPSSSKANLCQRRPRVSASLTAACAISSLSSAPASVRDGRPPFRWVVPVSAVARPPRLRSPRSRRRLSWLAHDSRRQRHPQLARPQTSRQGTPQSHRRFQFRRSSRTLRRPQHLA